MVKKGGVRVFYVVSNDLPTTAIAYSVEQAYGFRNKLVSLGYQANVIKIEGMI